jgi:hypothetical protein
MTTEKDQVLLFRGLPYEFDRDLPIQIVSGLRFAETPWNVLSSAKLSWACYVLPGYDTGLPAVHCCLVSPFSELPYLGRPRNTLFFEFIAALRLKAPIGIEISGSFEVGNDEFLINNPSLYVIESPWQPKHMARYSAADIDEAIEIFKTACVASEEQFERLRLAIVLFSQVTNGFSKSLQMAYLALFAALEALFAPNRNKAVTLAKRVSNFLKPHDPRNELREWIHDEYKKGRNKLGHGNLPISPDDNAAEEKRKSFGLLHEVVRLSLLGFLSMERGRWAGFSLTGAELQAWLEGLEPAQGRFIDEQFIWRASNR